MYIYIYVYIAVELTPENPFATPGFFPNKLGSMACPPVISRILSTDFDDIPMNIP